MHRSQRLSRLITMVLSCVALACQDTVTPGAPADPPGDITVTYLCGNNFDIRNAGTKAATAHYVVLGTTESGDLLLPGGLAGVPSITRLTTLERGSLRISLGDWETETVENGSQTCPPNELDQPEASSGQWTRPLPWPHVAVHLHLLRNGQVLSWGRQGAPQLYDPVEGTFSEVPSSTHLFCAGHAFLPDGRLLVSGGHLDDRKGLPDANVFDHSTGSWIPIQQMSYARWYPTNTTLANGEMLSLAGTDETGKDVEVPEVWNGSSWRSLTGAARRLPYYPRTFLAPNGLVFYAGELEQSAYLDPSGDGRWIPVATSLYGRRDYGSAVMYAPGKVMILGGSDPPDGEPTSSVELIDLNETAPRWRYTQPMSHARRHLNATLLLDGQVLVTGGTRSAGFSDRSGAVHAAELWDPAKEEWTLLADNQVSRVYHSTTLLLPDGRVLHAGSGDGPGVPRELTAEFFSPPYLFWGARPVIDDVPETISYGQLFAIATPDAGQVIRVTFLRLPSVTHAFDQSQRFMELAFRRTAGGLTVTGPTANVVAPPGPYLLAVVNSAGIPSVARILELR
ncbi:MAG TPA: galactose oxidase-like domain-containing protein [Gemmatimonadales bacterium]|nr:galactose oxidase-like domain-containing protein [Gemmatimonadales bacterium]